MTMTGYLGDLFSLSGKRALVTGGSSGIGLAMATAVGRAGAELILVARREPELQAAAAELAEAGVKAHVRPADLGDRTAIDGLATATLAEFGAPDILINSAGVNLRPPLDELTMADWDASIAVNLDAPFLLGQHFGPLMAERGWGRIINVGSQQSIRAFGNSGAYGVSKAGVLALTRSQAEAWSRHGVCVNAIAPGFVRTPLTAAVFADPAREAALAARTMVGRNGRTDDFAGIAVFLAGNASAYVTGQTIFVDGGFSAT
jgi:NAD(P)-dependent dehydrogenase (short-subunit alcohol dehydrogenase family)